MEKDQKLLKRFVKGIIDISEIVPFGVELPEQEIAEDGEFTEISVKELQISKPENIEIITINNIPEKTHLSELTYSMVKCHECTDFEVEIDETIFYCHLFVLQAYSSYFRNDDITMKKCIKIKLPSNQVTRKAFSTLYHWMMHDSLTVKRNGIIEVYNAANYLRIHELKKQCLTLLEDENNFIEDVAFQLFLEARPFKLDRIKSLMISRIKRYFLAAVATSEYLDLDVDEVCALISRNEICVHNETQVLMSVIRWLLHDWQNRKKYLYKIMKYIRFELMTPFDLCAMQSRALDNCEKELQIVMENPEVQDLILTGLSYVTMTYQCPMMKGLYYRNNYKRNEPENRTWIRDPYYIEKSVKPNNETISYSRFLTFLKIIRNPELESWKKFKTYGISPNQNLKMYRTLKEQKEANENTTEEQLLELFANMEKGKVDKKTCSKVDETDNKILIQKSKQENDLHAKMSQDQKLKHNSVQNQETQQSRLLKQNSVGLPITEKHNHKQEENVKILNYKKNPTNFTALDRNENFSTYQEHQNSKLKQNALTQILLDTPPPEFFKSKRSKSVVIAGKSIPYTNQLGETARNQNPKRNKSQKHKKVQFLPLVEKFQEPTELDGKLHITHINDISDLNNHNVKSRIIKEQKQQYKIYEKLQDVDRIRGEINKIIDNFINLFIEPQINQNFDSSDSSQIITQNPFNFPMLEDHKDNQLYEQQLIRRSSKNHRLSVDDDDTPDSHSDTSSETSNQLTNEEHLKRLLENHSINFCKSKQLKKVQSSGLSINYDNSNSFNFQHQKIIKENNNENSIEKNNNIKKLPEHILKMFNSTTGIIPSSTSCPIIINKPSKINNSMNSCEQIEFSTNNSNDKKKCKK